MKIFEIKNIGLKMSFPLFDMIYNETEDINHTLSKIDKENFCESIKKMDDEGYELLYALIKCYAIKYNKDYSTPPFMAKKCKAGYKFDVDVLPERLLYILIHFVKKHQEKLREDVHTAGRNIPLS